MKGVLILAHGSKQKETEETLSAIISALRNELRDNDEISEIAPAFLQFSDKNLHKGLAALTDKGIDDILVVPYFLFAGTHIKEDIPGEIEGFIKTRPGVKVSLGKTLGADRRLAMILKDRVTEML